MTIYYNATDRKPLVNAISEITGAKAIYMKTPTYAYKIGNFTVTREGNLEFDDLEAIEEAKQLTKELAQRGFTADCTQLEELAIEESKPDETATLAEEQGRDETALCISIPRTDFTEQALNNLRALVAAKGNLIKKALGVEKLPIEVTEEKVSFPWFALDRDGAEAGAYETFICKLCEMAKSQSRISAKEKTPDNEKYAFRCFLLRLGFIGVEFKAVRKILLRNLEGSSAFKSVQPKEGSVCA